MPQARNLAELFEIREHNRGILDAINSIAGTALGRKNGIGDPALLTFVDRKIGDPWLPPGQRIPARLTGPRGLECPTDVISAETDRGFWLRTYFDARGNDERGFELDAGLVDTNRLSGANLRLRDQLRGAGDSLTPGSDLSYETSDGRFESGTLGCFARDRGGTRDLGFLTNLHVGEFVGNSLWHPNSPPHWVGSVERGELELPVSELYGLPIPFSALVPVLKIDAAFCKLPPQLDQALIDPRLPTLVGDQIVLKELARPRRLDPTTMAPVGERVLGVGRTRGVQHGEVVAVSCDYRDGHRRRYTDLLIVGLDGDEFSDGGDSGKLVVNEALEPLGIMWGGAWLRRREGRDLENFTNATEIGRILDLLKVDIVRRI